MITAAVFEIVSSAQWEYFLLSSILFAIFSEFIDSDNDLQINKNQCAATLQVMDHPDNPKIIIDGGVVKINVRINTLIWMWR